MKIIYLMFYALLLCSCGMVDRTVAQYTGYSELCIDSVTYIQFTSGATVKVDSQGKPVQCK
jgi:hypothetical protein